MEWVEGGVIGEKGGGLKVKARSEDDYVILLDIRSLGASLVSGSC